MAINNLIGTAGSDCHHVSQPWLAGLEFSQPLESIADFVAAVKSRSGSVVTAIENPLATAAAKAY